jgi:queuine tRNA-ribosyltransferase
MGRHGTVFTADGKVQIQKSSNRTDRRPLTDECACPACTQYDRAYLRHLMVTEEPLGPRLLALHNLTFLMQLMERARTELAAGTFTTWSDEWLRRYRTRTAFTGSASANGR